MEMQKYEFLFTEQWMDISGLTHRLFINLFVLFNFEGSSNKWSAVFISGDSRLSKLCLVPAILSHSATGVIENSLNKHG